MAWELVFEELERLGFKRTYDPEDPDGNELTFQEHLFTFTVGEQEVIDGDMTAADVVRKMVQTLTNKRSQEEELAQLFGTRVQIVTDGEPLWTPSPPERKGRPFRPKGKPFKRTNPTEGRQNVFKRVGVPKD